MAATIDHLRSDHHVRVLKDFTDARGVTHGEGAVGIIRAMGLDTARMELWIDWEQEGADERLYFPLRATTGPGNGRMREYFAMGDEVHASSSAAAHASGSAALPMSDERSAPSTRSNGHTFPPAGTTLGARAVACSCDPALHRPVLALGTGVNACLRCGTVTYSQTIGDDGRHTGEAWHAYVVEGISDRLRHWLGRWPRVCVRRHDLSGWSRPAGLRRDEIVYLSADTRCETEDELLALETAGRAGVWNVALPTDRPPEALPSRLLAFGQFADAVQLTPHSELTDLMTSADPYNAACAFAVSRVLQRDDAFDVMVAALRSEHASWQGAGAAIAMAGQPFDPRLPDVLMELLRDLSIVPHARMVGRIAGAVRCEELLAVIVAHPVDTPALRAMLAQLQRRVARPDPELAGRIGEVLRVLHGLPSPRSGFSF